MEKILTILFMSSRLKYLIERETFWSPTSIYRIGYIE